MNAAPILQLQAISKRFGTIQALDQVDFDLYEGEIHALVGENGAGKSTLMRILSGVYTEYEGEFLLDGKPVHLHSPHDALDLGIGMIHQELSVMPELSVAENLFLGRQLTTRWGTVDWKKMHNTAEQELERLGFSHLDVRQPLGNYSLGTQQVVEVLRTIISGARVIIMDEPTSALSPAEVERLIRLIDKLRESKRSIIYISHFLEEVMRVADRVTVLRDGQKVATLNAPETNVNNLISLILGREVNATLPPAISTSNGHTLMEVNHLTADVFKDISFTINQGEVLGIYGAIGAGHFDLARALFGMYRFDTGTITVDGHRFKPNHSARYAIRHGLAFATESRRKSLLMEEAIYRNVTLPHLNRIGSLTPTQSQELKVAAPAIHMVNVQPPDPLNPVGKLSGGNQQKVAIARWLTFPPKVLVMSEPTRGMDVGAKSEVLSLLRNFRNQGYGVLVVSSEPETILTVSDRVIVMSHGHIVAHMENKDLNKDVLMRLL
ncbi:MAG: sugar ABC transporter ATP-binding protein [Chloroflexi bacterium]|nr:sugar ABC transporter ATP-binding protein [Chloroflexota bacterium]